MASSSQSLLLDLSEEQIKNEFDQDVRRNIMKTGSPRETLVKSEELKEEGNKFYTSKAFCCTTNRYDKSLQYLSVAIPKNEDDVKLMEEFGNFINLSITAC